MSFQPAVSSLTIQPSGRPSTGLSANRLIELFELAYLRPDCDLADHLHRVLEGCAKWFSAAGASIFVERVPGQFALSAKSGTDSRVPKDACIQVGKGIAGTCALSGEPMIVDNPESTPGLKGQGIHRRLDIGSAMIVPLMSPDQRCIGILNLSRRPSQPAFGDLDLSLARSVAAYVALSLSNAQLVERLNTAAREANVLKLQMEAVVASAGVGIMAFDESRRLVLCNPQASVLFNGGSLPGAAWASLGRKLPPELRTALRDLLSGKRRQVRPRVLDPHGRPIHSWLAVCSPMADGLVIAIQDQAEFERNQEELDRAKRLAETGQMAAAIAHEIRNPLTGIRGAAQIIREDPHQAAEFSDIIDAEVCKLNALCEEFLDFARPMRLQMESVRLSRVFAYTAKRLDSAFSDAQVSFSMEIAQTEPTIKGDPRRIEQVAHNLLRNAIEACRPGGHVAVHIGHRAASVRDDGCGMSKETLENLFVPFHTTKPGGTGLGLGNVRRILDSHRATIDVSSELGAGTEFSIAFPEGAE